MENVGRQHTHIYFRALARGLGIGGLPLFYSPHPPTPSPSPLASKIPKAMEKGRNGFAEINNRILFCCRQRLHPPGPRFLGIRSNPRGVSRLWKTSVHTQTHINFRALARGLGIGGLPLYGLSASLSASLSAERSASLTASTPAPSPPSFASEIPKSLEKGRNGFANPYWSARFANSLGTRCLRWQSTGEMHYEYAPDVRTTNPHQMYALRIRT
ncbi:MAG: hypothetical protein RLZZ519_3306 [Bacteroidota bacterium]|jgi:hypothetical protein